MFERLGLDLVLFAGIIANELHPVNLLCFRLCRCKLEGDCCEGLAVALSTESTQLKELDLSANNFQEAGVKALCVGMRSHNCKLQTVRLDLVADLNYLLGLELHVCN